MSNAIRYDSFLVFHLARELEHELRDKPVHALQFDSAEQRLLVDVGEIRLIWDLHPNGGTLTRTAPLYPLPDTAIMPKRARIKLVEPLPDERVLIIELAGERRENATFSVVIELMTNQWNAFALDHAGKVLRVLKLRESGRSFRRGQNYVPPEHPAENRIPYRSPLNETVDDSRWQLMLDESPQPALIEGQPYPHHLWRDDAQRTETLLVAFAAVAGAEGNEAVTAELERRLRAAEKKVQRLNGELAKAREQEAAIRAQADVLIAYATTITRGVSRVVLPAFSGGEVTIELDPRLSPMDNAKALYEQARKHERASARIPQLIADGEKQCARFAALLARARNGELSDADLAAIKEAPLPRPQQQQTGERLPYRRYRTSGGLEVRVGRNAKSNDELTLRHSSPRDIWMHARHVGGAHVVLRWHDADANPPQRDIIEAATLAAVHSASRTSKLVPVDYTRRKYVRKPRRSPAGTVMIERTKTVFVEPNAELEQKLRFGNVDLSDGR